MNVLENILEELRLIEEAFNKEISECKNNEDLNLLKNKFLGKKAKLPYLISSLVTMSYELKKTIGSQLLNLKSNIEKKIKNARFANIPCLDLSLPVEEQTGSIHSLSITSHNVKSILTSMSLNYMESPEVESEWRNFDVLNISSKHPTRENHQSFFLENGMLRTHTSSIQSYILEKYPNQDSKTFTIGKVFRKDNDSTHLPMFHQIEGFVIEKTANIPQMFSFIQKFLDSFFEKKMYIRKRASFFPFTNFSVEIDVLMNDRWIEILGCGIIHPNVFKNCNVSPMQGFAFGCGLERIHMLKNEINDIRSIYSKDARALKYSGSSSFSTKV